MDGVLGAGMIGGGFGGCTLNLVRKEAVEGFEEAVVGAYQTPEGGKPQIIKVVIKDGARRVWNRELGVKAPDQPKPIKYKTPSVYTSTY